MSKRTFAIIVAGFLTIFVAFAVRYAYGLLLPHMLLSFGSSKAGAGVVYSSYFISYTIFSLFLGVLVDRYDARILLTFFVLILAVGVFLMSRATSVMTASLFFTLAGIGQSACWVPVVTVVQRWVRNNRRGVVLAFVDLGSGIGIMTMSLVMPIIVSLSGWQKGWISLGVLAFMVGVLNFFLIRSYPPAQEQSRKTTQTESGKVSIWRAFSEVFRIKEFWLIGLSYLFICFAILIPFTFLTTYASNNLEVDFSLASRLIAVVAVSGIGGKLTLSALSDTLGRVKCMMICSFFVSTGGLVMALSESYFPLVGSSIVFGFGYGALWPIYAASARDFFPERYAGRVVGLWTVFLGVGSILSPILAGWSIDQTGRYNTAFSLVLIAGVISFILLFPMLLRPRDPETSPVESLNPGISGDIAHGR